MRKELKHEITDCEIKTCYRISVGRKHNMSTQDFLQYDMNTERSDFTWQCEFILQILKLEKSLCTLWRKT